MPIDNEQNIIMLFEFDTNYKIIHFNFNIENQIIVELSKCNEPVSEPQWVTDYLAEQL